MNDRISLVAELYGDPSQASRLSPDDAVALLSSLAALQVALLQAACRASQPLASEARTSTEDHLLEVADAASLLNVTPRWLYRHSEQLPFTRRLGTKVVRFSRAGIVKWLAGRKP